MFFLMTGLNDARLNGESPGGLQTYARALDTLFHALHDTAPHALVLAIKQPYIQDYSQHFPYNRASNAIIDRYNGTLETVTSQLPFAQSVVVDGWHAATMLADDTVHPNDSGHALLARAVVRAVTQYDGPQTQQLGRLAEERCHG